jgi:glutathione S-transferase
VDALELGLDYEQVQVGFGEDGVKSATFLAINPNGRVPAIEDGDFVLRESMAINLYLAKKHCHGFYPGDLASAAFAGSRFSSGSRKLFQAR